MWSGDVCPLSPHSLRKSVETLAHQRAGAMAGVLGLQPEARRPFGSQIVRIAFGREAFLFQLRAGAQRGFELARIVLAIVSGERQIVDVERPLGDVFPDAQGGQLIGRQARSLRSLRENVPAPISAAAKRSG